MRHPPDRSSKATPLSAAMARTNSSRSRPPTSSCAEIASIASQGVLCLRTANRVLVQDNVFNGQGRKHRRRAFTRRRPCPHRQHLPRSEKTKGLLRLARLPHGRRLETYGETDQLCGYGRARDMLIIRNRFEHCDQRIAAGIYTRKSIRCCR